MLHILCCFDTSVLSISYCNATKRGFFFFFHDPKEARVITDALLFFCLFVYRNKFVEFDMKPVCKKCYEKFPLELKKRLKKLAETVARK